MRHREKRKLSLWLIPWGVLDLEWPSTVVPNCVNGGEPLYPLMPSHWRRAIPWQSLWPQPEAVPGALSHWQPVFQKLVMSERPEEGLWEENHTIAPMCRLPMAYTWHRRYAYALPWWSCLAALSQRDLQHCLFSFNYHGYAPFHSNREVSQRYMCKSNVHMKAGICD